MLDGRRSLVDCGVNIGVVRQLYPGCGIGVQYNDRQLSCVIVPPASENISQARACERGFTHSGVAHEAETTSPTIRCVSTITKGYQQDGTGTGDSRSASVRLANQEETWNIYPARLFSRWRYIVRQSASPPTCSHWVKNDLVWNRVPFYFPALPL